MPTIIFETNVSSQEFKRHVSKKVSMWLNHEGIPINHVITKYRNVEASDIYSGPYAFDRFPCAAESELKFAFISCHIAQDRSDQFKAAMAHVIVQAAQNEIKPNFIFINFHPVDPNNYFNGDQIDS